MFAHLYRLQGNEVVAPIRLEALMRAIMGFSGTPQRDPSPIETISLMRAIMGLLERRSGILPQWRQLEGTNGRRDLHHSVLQYR